MVSLDSLHVSHELIFNSSIHILFVGLLFDCVITVNWVIVIKYDIGLFFVLVRIVIIFLGIQCVVI